MTGTHSDPYGIPSNAWQSASSDSNLQMAKHGDKVAIRNRQDFGTVLLFTPQDVSSALDGIAEGDFNKVLGTTS